jgi:serine/threonine protein kinase
MFGKYRLRGLLGKGGMARVYLAEDTDACGPRRWNALKIPERKFCEGSDYMRMFEAEVGLATQISHPHVCAAFEYGSWNGTPFLAMEFLRGRSLLSLRKASKPFENPRRHALRVARLIADACEGLQAIHDYGTHEPMPPRIVHRDISPDNLFLTLDGFVKILDFGLAQTDLTRDEGDPGLLRGKISYIAPELLNRQGATCQSDVWGLGVVAWELLAGRSLFNEVSDYETLVAVKEQTIPAPSQVVPGIPPSLDDVILRALQRDPEARFKKAGEFGAALWDFMLMEKDVVHHAELADWLESLFPADHDAFACLSSLDWPDVVQRPSSRAGSAASLPIPDRALASHATVAHEPVWRLTLKQVYQTVVASVARAWVMASATVLQTLAHAAALMSLRITEPLPVVCAPDALRANARVRRAGELLLTNSDSGEVRENPEYVEYPEYYSDDHDRVHDRLDSRFHRNIRVD